jgi:O-antigen ligase
VRRSFLSSSGRVEAWKGALRQAEQRPLLGYGFGTESRVFVDRYYTFVAGLPENSYVGLALQLGTLGVLALLGLVAILVLPARRALLGPRRTLVAACTGAVLAGLVLAGVQSYVYAVGNIAAATFWICAFLVPAAADA